MTTTKKVIVAIAVTVALMFVIWLALGSTSAWSDGGVGNIDRWETSTVGIAAPNMVLTSAQLGGNGRVNQWRTTSLGVRSRLNGQGDCFVKTAHVVIRGGNAVVFPIIQAHMTMTWGTPDFLGHGHFCQSPRMNTWGDDGNPLWLWSYDGVTDVVKGSGRTNPPQCSAPCDYVYRRAYYRFSRTFEGLGQNVRPWISMTVRGNGTCNYSKMEGGSGAC